MLLLTAPAAAATVAPAPLHALEGACTMCCCGVGLHMRGRGLELGQVQGRRHSKLHDAEMIMLMSTAMPISFWALAIHKPHPPTPPYLHTQFKELLLDVLERHADQWTATRTSSRCAKPCKRALVQLKPSAPSRSSPNLKSCFYPTTTTPNTHTTKHAQSQPWCWRRSGGGKGSSP